MKRFHFSLRPAAVLRAHRELLAREALATALRALGEAQIRLSAARERSAELETVIAAGRRKQFQPAAEAVFYQAYLASRAAELEHEKLVAAAAAELQRRRNACIEANRELKVIERIELRAREAHRQDNLRSEQNEIDEIAGFRAFQTASSL
jgi:flagellar protein FliJ